MKKINRLIAGIALLLCAAFVQAQSADTGKRGEVYVGIISFDQTVRDMTGGKPRLLDEKGRADLENLLDTAYKRAEVPGTSLYYAVHQALASLSANEASFPDNIATVNIVTFTDGLDNNSTSPALRQLENQNFTGRRISEYQGYLNGQIESRRVRGKPVTAYSVGLRGRDVDESNSRAFMESLRTVASNPKDQNAQEITDFDQLKETFQEIAENLTKTNTVNTFTLETPVFPVGTKVRMTFDVPIGTNAPSAAANSRNYFEGEVTYTGGQYRLVNIKYSGNIASSSGQQVIGTFDQVVKYKFEKFDGYIENADRQWSQTEGSAVWQVNSEYEKKPDPSLQVETNPTAIYLVLDCSTSMEEANVDEIRKAAKEFLDILYRGATETKQAAESSKQAAQPARTPSVASKPAAAEPAPKPAPAPKSAPSGGFTFGDRIAAAALNTAFGLGSMLIMQDFVGGGIEAGGYVAGVGLIVWELMLTYEENRPIIGIPGTIGLAALGTSFVWGVVRPFLYNRPGSSVAAVLDNIHIDLVSDRQGKPALNMTYRMDF